VTPRGHGQGRRGQRIAFLAPRGTNPHNGLGGLEFDSKGNLYFGMGENLGADYKLIGSGRHHADGGGEGGNIYWCTADGKKLRKVATGFWNPFACAATSSAASSPVDNESDSMPAVPDAARRRGGDYGSSFRMADRGGTRSRRGTAQDPRHAADVCGVGEAPARSLATNRTACRKVPRTCWSPHGPTTASSGTS